VLDLPILTPIVLTFSNDGFRCIMTREGRIKDCWFFGVRGYNNTKIKCDKGYLSSSNKIITEKWLKNFW
jgi:hypothetical protein